MRRNLRIKFDPVGYPKVTNPGWHYFWPPRGGGGGNYATWNEAVEAAYQNRNDDMARCPMCGSHDGRFQRERWVPPSERD